MSSQNGSERNLFMSPCVKNPERNLFMSPCVKNPERNLFMSPYEKVSVDKSLDLEYAMKHLRNSLGIIEKDPKKVTKIIIDMVGRLKRIAREPYEEINELKQVNAKLNDKLTVYETFVDTLKNAADDTQDGTQTVEVPYELINTVIERVHNI